MVVRVARLSRGVSFRTNTSSATERHGLRSTFNDLVFLCFFLYVITTIQMLQSIPENKQTEFEPNNLLAGLEEASLSGNAYTYLRQYPKRVFVRTVDKIFQKYFQIERNSHPYEPHHSPANTKTTLQSLAANEFLLTVAGKNIRIVLSNDIKLERFNDVYEVRLSTLPTHAEVQDRLFEIAQEPVKRKRRSMLSEYYLDCCMLNDVEPLIKYPHGNEERYKKLIQDVCCNPVRLEI